MKNITRLAMLAAVAAGFASCSIREMAAPEVPANRVSITVNAGLEQTKTVFGAPENGVIPVTWASEGEQLVLFEIADGVASQSDTAEVYTLENGGANAKFQFAFAAGSAASYDYFALYPASARRTVKAGNYGVNNQVTDFAWPDAFQKSTADGPDPNHCLFLSTLKGQTAQPTELNMKFQHLCGYGKVSIKDLKLVSGEKAESISITFENDTVVGRYGLMPDGSMKLEAGAAKAIKIDLATIAPEGGNFAAWFAAKPFTFNAGDKATVVVSTNKRAFTKEIAATADLSFEAGSATAFTVDMSTADAPEALGGDKELVFDFSTAIATLPSWPTSATGVDGEYVYPLDGVDYSFYLYKTCAAAAQITVYNAGSAIGLPVISGHKLVAVVCSSAKGKTSYKGSISSDMGGTQVVKGGETQNWTAVGNYAYKLEETAADTRYWIYGVGPLPVKKITLYYDKVGETPSGPQPYEYPEVKPAFKPILNVILDSNCALNGNALVFTANDTASVAGAKIERIGGNIDAASPVLSATAHGDSYITTKGWDQNGAAIVYSTPLPHEISGKVRFAFSVNTNKLWEHLTKMEVCWSTDGTNWTPVNGLRHVLAESNTETPNIFKFADNAYNSHRSVAEIILSAPISAGTTFYVKVESIGYKEGYSKAEAQTVRVNVGSILYSAPEETAFPTGDNIVYSENFASCTAGADLHIGVPMYYFANVNKNKLTDPLPGGIVATGSVTPRSGCICSNDNKVDATYITLPALTKLTEPTDVMLTFKEALFTGTSATLTKYPNGLSVAISGPGELGELKWKTDPASDYYAWHVAYVPIKGATAETVITMGNTKGLPINDGNYYYLDDIVITK